MFVTLFLGTVIAVFVTLNAVRGDAERGLLQPLVVRPIGRSTLLLARFVAAGAVCVVYVLIVYGAALVLTHAPAATGPTTPLYGGLSLSLAVLVVVALALLGTTLLSSTGERHRDLHGLRRGPRVRAHRPDRLGAGLDARSSGSRRSRRGRCRSRRSTRTACTR